MKFYKTSQTKKIILHCSASIFFLAIGFSMLHLNDERGIGLFIWSFGLFACLPLYIAICDLELKGCILVLTSSFKKNHFLCSEIKVKVIKIDKRLGSIIIMINEKKYYVIYSKQNIDLLNKLQD